MIIKIPTLKYGSTYYNTFTMGVCRNYHGYFFQCIIRELRSFMLHISPALIIFEEDSAGIWESRQPWASRLFSKSMKVKILNFLHEVEKMISIIAVQV